MKASTRTIFLYEPAFQYSETRLQLVIGPRANVLTNKGLKSSASASDDGAFLIHMLSPASKAMQSMAEIRECTTIAIRAANRRSANTCQRDDGMRPAVPSHCKQSRHRAAVVRNGSDID